MSRTTLLVGTFAAICLAQAATAQIVSRPRTGGVVANPRAQPPQTGEKPALGGTAATPQNNNPKQRIGGIAPAPAPANSDRDNHHDSRQSPTVFYVVSPGYPGYTSYSNYPAYETYSSYSNAAGVYPSPQSVTYVAPSTTNITYVQPAPTPSQWGSSYIASLPNVSSQPATNYFNVPAIIFNDGRIYANFTGAYEQVLRQCAKNTAPVAVAGTVNAACWTLDADGRYSIVQGR